MLRKMSLSSIVILAMAASGCDPGVDIFPLCIDEMR